MTNHTPGPWSTDGRVLRNAVGNSIASGGNNRVVTGDELDASMTLAAAAPDLLAALQEVLDHTPEPHAGDAKAILERARAAVAKATGGQP